MNRVVNASGSDHADTTTSLSGYTQDMVLGYTWSSVAVPGVVQLTEAFDSSTGDYALLSPNESLPGHNPVPMAAYGYPRYGGAPEVLLSAYVERHFASPKTRTT